MIVRLFGGMAIFVSMLFVLGLIVGLIEDAESPEDRAAREARSWHLGVFSASARVISETLRDPASAQWRNRIKWQTPDENLVAVCGELNARNAFGGYVGFAPFYSIWRREGGNARHVRSNILFAGATITATGYFERNFRRYCSGRAIASLG